MDNQWRPTKILPRKTKKIARYIDAFTAYNISNYSTLSLELETALSENVYLVL